MMGRFEFRLADLGEGLAEAEVVQWLVKPGDRVAEDQAVVLLLTDKATVEMPSPRAGIILEYGANEGDLVKVGDILLTLDPDSAAEPSGFAEMTETQSTGPQVTAEMSPKDSTEHEASHAPLRPRASPALRKLAREAGIDLATVRGTGPAGRITGPDIRALIERNSAPPLAETERVPTATPTERPRVAEVQLEERKPLRGIARRVAETMTKSASTIPHVTDFHEFDAERLMELYERLKQRSERQSLRFRFDTLLVRATVVALRDFPLFNSSLDDATNELIIRRYYHVGVAMATPQGLVVPVIQSADKLAIMDIAAELNRLVDAARANQLSVADLRNGTITITNSGIWGGWLGTSLIRPPEAAILGFGMVRDQPVARKTEVLVRPVLPVAINVDHRIIDGEQTMLFGRALRELIEHPELLFLEP